MKKNRMMRLASLLLVLVLMTSSVVGGTFAKYTTSVEAETTARVAKWGFEPAEIELDNLFKNVYEMTGDTIAQYSVVADDATDVIAPGTTGFATFAFNFDETSGGGIDAPEVAYSFEVDIDATSIDDSIKNNTNIKWQLDDKGWMTWADFVAAVEELDGYEYGAGKYEAGTLPEAFNTDGEYHTITWKWAFDENDDVAGFDATDLDGTDTEMGNADDLADVTIKIKVTATQID